MSEKEKDVLRKALDESAELTDDDLDAVAGGDCNFCQTCLTGEKATEVQETSA